MKDRLYNIFLKVDGTPNSNESLIEYIEFVLNNKYDGEEYSEVHHILPRSRYIEYVNDSWNLIRLKYLDHIKAHELLFKSYNIREYQRTLNFMNSEVAKDSKLISNASKKGWLNLKKNKKKYDAFCEKRRNYMSSLSDEEQSRRSKLGWDKLDEDGYKKRCKINKENWTDALKKNKSAQMKEFFKNNPDESRRRVQERWDSISEEKRTEFIKKMDNVNKDPIKRANAGKIIKEKWQDPDFIEKMKNRKKKPGDVYELKSPTGEILKREGLHKFVNEFNFNISLIRKFANTNQQVSLPPNKKIKNEKTTNTIGWIFNKIN